MEGWEPFNYEDDEPVDAWGPECCWLPKGRVVPSKPVKEEEYDPSKETDPWMIEWMKTMPR